MGADFAGFRRTGRGAAPPAAADRLSSTLDDLRRLSLALPGAHEVSYKGDPWFNVGKKTFACHFGDRTILKLDKGHQELLFEIRPQTFSRCKVGTGYWSFVELDHLDEAELAALLLEGWASIVPKKVSRPYLQARQPNP